MNKLIWPLLLTLLLLAPAAFAGDFLIVPGQRIGTVTLGIDRASVRTLLHAPSTTRRMHGLILDTWLSHGPAASPDARYSLKHDYLTVFFRNGHAVQIEVSAPKFKTADGLSARSSGSGFARHYPGYKTPHFAGQSGPYVEYSVIGDSAASSPASKHFVAYGDAVREGVAWKAGA